MTKSVLVRFSTNRNQVGGDLIFDSDFYDKNHREKYYTGSAMVYQMGNAWILDRNSVEIEQPKKSDATKSSNDIVAFANEQMNFAKKRRGAKEPNYGVVFLHGFNTSFVRAIEEAAQIGATYSANSMFCFSWPSIGKGVSRKSYLADQKSAELSAPAIANAFLSLLSFLNSLERPELPPINIVAHSMGNHALSGAIQIISQKHPAQIQKDLFEGVLLMAADEAQDALSDAGLLGPLAKLAKRVTSYYSGRDLVLTLSQIVNGRVPLGLTKPTRLASLDGKVTAVDCSDVGSTQDENGKTEYGHGYFRGSPWVLNDVRQLLANIAPKDIKGRLKDIVDDEGGHAWWLPYDSGAAHTVHASAKHDGNEDI
jgi:esterase/lipase superfamily enzyme